MNSTLRTHSGRSARWCHRLPSALALSALLLFTPAAPVRAAEASHYLAAGGPQPDLLAPPPLPGSAEHAADLAQVVAVSKACTSNEAAVAFSEKKFSILTFTPAIGSFFQAGKFPKTEAFCERVLEEAKTATDHAKDYWKRPRPYTIDTNLASGKLEKSFGYPSGHSTEATVLALVLTELFPERHDAILAIGRDIGWHRVLIARHYPTDIHAGRVFAQAIVREMKTNPDFQRDFQEAKAELAAAQGSVKAAAQP